MPPCPVPFRQVESLPPDKGRLVVELAGMIERYPMEAVALAQMDENLFVDLSHRAHRLLRARAARDGLLLNYKP